MPPAETRKEVSPEELDILKRWIADDAEYQEHWAFVKPTRPDPPSDDRQWCVNTIDQFVLKRLEVAIDPKPAVY